MPETFDVVVIGAGISGTAVGYYLKKAGVARVAIMERSQVGAGGTGKSAAIVRQHYSTELLARVAKESVEIFTSLSEEIGHDIGFAPVGYLFLVPAGHVGVAKRSVDMQRRVGVDTVWIAPEELSHRFPWLSTEELIGGVYEARGGYADPIKSAEGYLKGFMDLGGIYMPKTASRGLIRENHTITGALTDDGPIHAGAVINAAGPWAAALSASVNIPLAMRTVREQETVWEARPNRPLPEISVSAGTEAIYVRPLGSRRYIVGRGFPKLYEDVDPCNFKETADHAFISDVSARLERRFPPMAGARLLDSFAALYDVTPDWYPFVGPRAGLNGYFDFNGGSGHGFKIAPALAFRLSNWIVNATSEDDFARLSYDRVEEGTLFERGYGGNRG